MEEKLLLLGDQAVALGAIHAGITGVYAYPGTPSTEITEYIQTSELATLRGVHSRWCTNEKTAMEAALGVSYVGKRALVCMKHVGLNVAADAFVNSAVTGTNGGLVVLVADYLYYRNKKLKISLENRGRELIAAKEKAEESDMLKSAFLANMSHEIRTPLNAIVGFSALLGDESISEEDRNVYMGIVNQNSDLLLTLIGDILDISRLETGKISFTLHPENIVAICQQVISTTAHGRKKDVECVFNPPVESFILKTDSQRLSQVLINLLTNASKFTEKGTIALAFEIQKEQRRILFSVSDTGCGIPRERQERVFNRFEKLNEFKQGTGLGLAICKQIVLRFGGNIWIDPEYTEGARFVFSHPIVP